jgi:integrase
MAALTPNRASLTQLGCERLRAKDKEQIVWDTNLPGFGLRVSPKGVKTFILQYRYRTDGGKLKERQEALGRLNFLTVAEARDRARQIKSRASAGFDPLAERRAVEAQEKAERARSDFTVARLVDRYMVEYADQNTKASTANVTRCNLGQWVSALGDRSAADITKSDILAFLNGYLAKRKDGSGRLGANNLLRALSHVFKWAMERDLVPSNPTEGVAKPAPRVKARDRYLDVEEIKSFWSACDRLGWPVGPIFQLLLLTGAREREVGEMRWSELNLAERVWNLPATRTKNGKAHIIHLSDLAVEIIGKLPMINRSQFVFTISGAGPFTNYDYGKKRLQRIMGGATDWRPHDLRRTATTVMAELGIAPHVADRVLNHTSGTIQGVAAIYNRFQYLEERKAALNALGQYIERLIGRNVIPLRSRTEVS